MELIQSWFCINYKQKSFKAFRTVICSSYITANALGLFVHLSSLEMMLKAGTKHFIADIFVLEQTFFSIHYFWMLPIASLAPLKMGTY